ASMARELEQKTALLTSALAAEFDAPVPTEQLRRRVDAAVADLHVPVVAQKRNFFGSLTSLFNFAPQQALGYAGLILVLAFAAIFGVLKMRSVEQPQPTDSKVAEVGITPAPPTIVKPEDAIPPIKVPSEVKKTQPVVNRLATSSTSVPRKQTPVKLIPGERAYLQTIA